MILGDPIKIMISSVEYERFKQEYVFYALADKRYGQAFCEKYSISTASPLYWFNDANVCDRWIADRYVNKTS